MTRQQHAATLSHARVRRDAAEVAVPPASAPSGSPFGVTSSSGSTDEHVLTSPATTTGSRSPGPSRTLFARLFRLKDRSPAAPTPLLLQGQQTPSPLLYGEEEETKVEAGRARTDSPMMALFRSLNLRSKAALAQQEGGLAPRSTGGGRSRRTRIPAQAAGMVTSVATTVVAEGLLTKLVPQRYWHSKQAYFALEETLGDGGGTGPPHVRFTLRQYRRPEPGAAPELLMAVIALSENDVVTDLRDDRHVKFALELQFAIPPQYTELGGITSPLASSQSANNRLGLHSLRLAASDSTTHSRWLRALSACIAKLIVQSETHYPSDYCAWNAAVARIGSGLSSPPLPPVRKGSIVPPAKIAPLSGDEMEFNSSNGSEYSNNHHEGESEAPVEEIRAARSDDDALETKARAPEVQQVAGLVHGGLDVDVAGVVIADEQPKRCATEDSRSPENSDSVEDNNALSDDDRSRSSSEIGNQGEDASPDDSEGREQVSAACEDTRTTPGSRLNGEQLPRGAVGPSSVRGPPLVAPVRPQLHSFNANGQVFTLDVRYQLLKPIGTGAYGAVIAVKDMAHGGESLAVKKITNIFEDLVDAKRILREVRLLHHFRHKNITRLIDLAPPLSRKHLDDMYIITELMETDLHQVIYSMQPMSDDHVKYFLYQMLCALQHIHSAGVLHRDMKPSNILLNSNCDLKICDFGLARGGLLSADGHPLQSKLEPQAGLELTEYVVTRWYRAPEIMLNCLHYTTAIDVWAVGCIFAEMLLREPLFPGNDYLHQLKLIIKFLGTPKQEDTSFVKNAKALRFLTKLAISKPKKWRDVFAAGGAMESEVSPEAIDLLSKMLLFNPDKRISVDAALRHPYLSTFFDESDLVSSTPFDFSFDLPDEQLTKDALVDLLCEDIEHFHPPIPPSTAPLNRSSAASRFFRMGMTASAS